MYYYKFMDIMERGNNAGEIEVKEKDYGCDKGWF
jgi:hypothetical protein